MAVVGFVFVCVDAICSTVPRFQTAGVNYLFQITAPLLAVAACLWRARSVAGPDRARWNLLAMGLLFWDCGIALSAWEDLLQHVPFQVASLSDFAFFFYGVPILFALARPAEGPQYSAFAWLDGIQAIFAGYLTYITIFSALPFSTATIQPISVDLLIQTYNVENAALAGICILRLFASSKDTEAHRFYRILCAFLVIYGVGAGIYNQIATNTNGQTEWDALVIAPLLLLALMALFVPVAENPETSARRSKLGLFIDFSSPIFFTIALLALGMVTLRQHFLTGIVAISVGLAVYGVRTTLLQIRDMQTQKELQEARDRLEAISLQDGLTGIANRRHFDQVLESEWLRAMRTLDPLSLLLIDLDYFKNLNDTYGHPHGDRCLIEVATALSAVAARSGDLVARYGGEEFAAILPATTREAAEAIASKMRVAIHDLKIKNQTEIGSLLSTSIGISTYVSQEVGSPAMLIETSDQALYKAKQNGRNRVEFAYMQPTQSPSYSN
ncbi:GGDEF domain-containing protein [Acidicapsa acidisoli]|uniref:GGDEF domain-containing protein n=1 Tax=Acidicapsa acidisoli TaxID=1615681 RepID=UPI0021DF9910|nr:diguanylate cyclase [Acidicapsa acidisoli]